MHKFLSVLCLLGLLISMAVPIRAAGLLPDQSDTTAAASGNEYYLEELDMTLTIPSVYDVLTHSMDENDPLFAEYGMTKEEFVSTAADRNLYLEAISSTIEADILVTMTPNTISDFSCFDEAKLLSLADRTTGALALYGATVQDYSIHHHDQTPFIKYHYFNESTGRYSIHYYTVYHYQAINLVLHSLSGDITSVQESTLRHIVSSIRFGTDGTSQSSGSSSPLRSYTDPQSGVSFSVPANWQEKALSTGRDILQVKFVNPSAPGTIICYGHADCWAIASPEQKTGYTRQDWNMDQFSEEDFTDILGTGSTASVKRVQYNGIEYFHLETTQPIGVSGYTLDVTTTQLCHVRNGWIYLFQFAGTASNPLYGDFEALMNSVVFPGSDAEADTPTTDSGASAKGSDTPGFPWPVVILVIVVAAVIVTVVILLLRRPGETTVPTRQQPTPQPVYAPPAYPQQPTPQLPVIYCPNCGAQLPADSCFCHFCGVNVTEP